MLSLYRYRKKTRRSADADRLHDAPQILNIALEKACNSGMTLNVSTPPLSFYRPDALPAAQPTALNKTTINILTQYKYTDSYFTARSHI